MKRAQDTKWRESVAYAPRALVSMVLALVAFAIVTYFVTGSFATTALRTFVCAVLIQVGYFLATLFLVWRTAKARKAEADDRTRGSRDVDKGHPKIPVTPMNEPGHSQS